MGYSKVLIFGGWGLLERVDPAILCGQKALKPEILNPTPLNLETYMQVRDWGGVWGFDPTPVFSNTV